MVDLVAEFGERGAVQAGRLPAVPRGVPLEDEGLARGVQGWGTIVTERG